MVGYPQPPELEDYIRMRRLIIAVTTMSLATSGVMATAKEDIEPDGTDVRQMMGLDPEPSVEMQLFDAAKRGDLDRVTSLLQNGADVDGVVGVEQWTPLMIAAREGHLDVVRALVSAGADLDAIQRRSGDTALSLASEEGNAEIAEILRSFGATEPEPPLLGRSERLRLLLYAFFAACLAHALIMWFVVIPSCRRAGYRVPLSNSNLRYFSIIRDYRNYCAGTDQSLIWYYLDIGTLLVCAAVVPIGWLCF